MESPEINAKLLVEQCIAIYINRSTSCIACYKVQPVNNEEEFVTGKHEPNKLTCSPLCDFIAQLVRALHRHRRGHGFESH